MSKKKPRVTTDKPRAQKPEVLIEKLEPLLLSASFTKDEFKRQNAARWWRVLNYLSIYLAVLVIIGGGVLADYVLSSLIWLLLREEIQKYSLVASVVDYAKIGLALMALVGALVHGGFSVWGQIQAERRLSREDD